MCVNDEREAEEAFLLRHGHKDTIRCWKSLTRRGRSPLEDFCYYPGWNYPKGKQISEKYNYGIFSRGVRGLHVWLAKNKTFRFFYKPKRHRVLPVTVRVADIIACDEEQLACRALYIDPKDWKAAGLPPRKTRPKRAGGKKGS